MKNNILITIFTPTYNRGYIIENLYKSLKTQISNNFEWLVIDDGSTDNTEELFKKWNREDNKFNIRYVKTDNNGKPRAINKALEIANGRYLFMVDSDDHITNDAILKIEKWISEIDDKEDIIAVGAARVYPDGKYIKGIEPNIDDRIGYIDATNLERKNYNLDADMCEAYKIDILKRFPFEVWDGEKFAPEEITLNEIALHGYKVRWHKDKIYICDYLDDGLTKGSWNLLKSNPMGYAMLYNHKLKFTKSLSERFNYCCQHIALSIIGKQYNYIFKSNAKLLNIMALPFGLILSIRRKKQFMKDEVV
ncbi:MAG: glycosyltransferase family 2 protein [Terrisporobacter othiniensis]|uniref:glycosyltransferase family 2 protein n=1 Tax=Terrisporobacter othiniensis TaxID=1577792 RepID=UPI00290E93C0|nr:glycosyltransferase family 2 protein [Terrisporobacter othiniensis]MDU6983127.1 glycosyltransferase family 2 protein [Terrisporobacter othiniensis]